MSFTSTQKEKMLNECEMTIRKMLLTGNYAKDMQRLAAILKLQ